MLQIYKEEVDPNFTWDNFTIEEQAKILAAGRSNNFLDTGKLEAAAKQLGMPLPDIHTAVRQAMKEARASLEAQGTCLAPRPRCRPLAQAPAPLAAGPLRRLLPRRGMVAPAPCAAEFAAVEYHLGMLRLPAPPSLSLSRQQLLLLPPPQGRWTPGAQFLGLVLRASALVI